MPAADDPSDELLGLACLTYGPDDGPDRWAQAQRMLRADPSLPERKVWAAAVVGDPDLIRAHLAERPDLATAEGGPRQWSPLLHLAYSRLPQRDPVAAATLLLDAGADPNDGFRWGGLPTPFTVLTGCFGEGEQGPGRQPRHPAGAELAGLLLDHGADPNDAQTLYNRMFGRDDSHLRLLLAHGLGQGAGGVWHDRTGPALESPAEMVRRQVDWAADHGLVDRLRLLAEHGFATGTDGRTPWRRRRPPHPLDRIGTPAAVRAAAADGLDLDALVDGRTLLHQAAFLDDAEMVRALLAAGARTDIVDLEHGTTPLQWAQWAFAERVAALLRDV